MIRLHVRRLKRDDRVARRVGFIKTISAEFQDMLEDLLGFFLAHAFGDGPFQKLGLHLRDHFTLLFTDRLDEFVGAAQLDPTELIENLHDLFLVDHDSIGLFQNFIHDRMHLRHLLTAVLAVAIARDQFHRPRSIQRVGGDEIFQTVRLHLHQKILHAAGFKLKDAARFTPAEKGQHLFIGKVDFLDIDAPFFIERRFLLIGRPFDRPFFPRFAFEVDRARDAGKGSQAQKVHLQQAAFLGDRPFKLRQHVAVTVAIEGHDVIERLIGDDHTRRMATGVTAKPFQPFGNVNHLLDDG